MQNQKISTLELVNIENEIQTILDVIKLPILSENYISVQIQYSRNFIRNCNTIFESNLRHVTLFRSNNDYYSRS